MRALLCSLWLVLAVVSTPAFAAEIPRPEHPNPQFMRAEWLNLNGPWDFGETNEDEAERFLSGGDYPEKIIVPFCREAKASGLGRREFVKNVWYRRSFEVPADWKSKRIRLHIGACDWRTEVWLNGVRLGEHVGGNVSFHFDATEAVHRDKPNTLIVHAFDDTASGLQPLGKQSISGKSEGIFYTQTTGIWQTVWLEGVGESYVRELRVEPRPESNVALMTVDVDGPVDGLNIEVEVHTPEARVAQGIAHAQWRDAKLLLAIPNARKWSLEDPYLYHLRILLKRGDYEIVDELGSYFGMRSVTVDGNAILLNGKPVFQRLVLDQGFYPDGVWTAPTDEALRGDIELAKAAGFNGARLHQKVFEPRFHYWADTLGYLCWGEYPSYGADYGNPAVNAPIIREWNEIIARDRNHPSIIGWCPFNETPESAEVLQDTILDLTRQLDPARPCLETSGWVHHVPDPEVMDVHDYEQNPEVFGQRWAGDFPWKNGLGLPARYGVGGLPKTPMFISEYGGIGWSLDENAWGYGNTPKTIEEFHARFDGLSSALLSNRHLFGLCYTQLTDIEQEQNGVYFYDRTPKFDTAKLRGVLSKRAAYEEDPPTEESLAKTAAPVDWRVLIGSVHDGGLAREWRYTTDAPAEGWQQPGFDASAWSAAPAPFGLIGGEFGRTVRTKWRTGAIWLLQEFEAHEAAFDAAILVIFHDDTTQLWLNGESIWKREGWTTKYQAFDITEALRKHLKPGTNILAAHVTQDRGGQFFDMALLIGNRNGDGTAGE
jgi:hypothetical protein